MRADNHLFLDIQMGKYLKQNNKGNFDSDIGAKDVIGKIINAWNDKIAVEKEKLDTLDEAARIPVKRNKKEEKEMSCMNLLLLKRG